VKNVAFESAYKGLNIKQKEAIDSIEGPVMVIAGPGTGKTTVLTLRIAQILSKTDTPASGILALTFTESGVHSMRRKLVEYIGTNAYRVHIFTFHGFAQEIITRYPEYFPRIIGGAVISDSERYEILEEALEREEFEIIRPLGKPTLYVPKALSVIKDLKRDEVDPAKLSKILADEKKRLKAAPDRYHEKGRLKGELKKEYVDSVRNNEKNTELALLYSAYEKALRKRSLYDFEDMLIELVRALRKHKDLLRTLQEEYLYVLADEHQDANNAQNSVLELLCDYQDTRNLFIVGDEKQAIYRFQGASLENFLYFQKKFPEARVIFLNENYRSTQTILDVSHQLMAARSGDEKLRPRLISASRTKHVELPIKLYEFETSEDEYAGVAEEISKAIHEGIPAEEIAILVRTNAEISIMGRALAEYKVPHTLFADDDALGDSDIGKLLLLLRAVVFPENDALVGSMLLIDFLGIHPLDAVRLNRTAREVRRSPLELIARGQKRLEFLNEQAVDRLSREFLNWMERVNNESALDSFLFIVQGSGFQKYLLKKPDSMEKLAKLVGVYDGIKAFLVTHKDAKLKDFISSVDRLLRHGSPLRFSRTSLGARGVLVMTAHKSKGLEWQRVYIVNCADKVWGNRRAMGSFRLPAPLSSAGESEQDDDERRLFYVALTRAKESVSLSFARLDAHGTERLVSRFVEELRTELVEKIVGRSFKPEERILRSLEGQNQTHSAGALWDRAYLRELFLEHGINATALNNYLECPWKYFFKNLVRLPDIPGSYLQFGTATHSALKALTDAKREKKEFSKRDFVDVFRSSLGRLPLSTSNLTHILKKGESVLPKYFDARTPFWHADSLAEYVITGVFLTLTDKSNLLLRGRIDKLELLSGGTVNVVDYKTGARRTRNDILGQTKNSNGDIKRQLDFYRLLLELHDGGKYEMVSAGIDFVEPDAKGKIYPIEKFTMSHDDALSVREEVVRVAGEIVAFSFWDATCDEDDCQWCGLRKFIA